MSGAGLAAKRKIFCRLGILPGNAIQVAGILATFAALRTARSAGWNTGAFLAMVAGWVLLYFCCHGIAHWVVGRIVGIRFAYYTVGGTGNPEGLPGGLRWVLE